MGGDHKCPVCQATFTRPQHVARHMRSHTGDRPYKCQYCGDQFARSDLLSRHVNKCHANEKPLPPAPGGRRKGPASASRATTSKQACDQCVQSSLPCDGCNPCAKCVQRKCRCTFVKFHRQTAPSGPGHTAPPTLTTALSTSLGLASSSTGGIRPLMPPRFGYINSNVPTDEFVLAPPPPNMSVSAPAQDLLFTDTFGFPTMYTSSGVESDYAAKYRQQAELLRLGAGGTGTGTGVTGMYASSPVSSASTASSQDPRWASGAGWQDGYHHAQEHQHTQQQQQQQQQQIPLAGQHHSSHPNHQHHHHEKHPSDDIFSSTSSGTSTTGGSSTQAALPIAFNTYRKSLESLDFGHIGGYPYRLSQHGGHLYADSTGGGSDGDAGSSVPSSAASSSVHLPLGGEVERPSSSYSNPAQQQQQSHPAAQDFHNAFGAMSLDDPGVLAGLTTDAAPFFSDPFAGSTGDPEATPMPPSGATSKEDKEGERAMWKEFLRTPLSGPNTSNSIQQQQQAQQQRGARQRVASLPSVKTPGPGFDTSRTAHEDDLRSYEAAVMARKAPVQLTLQPRLRRPPGQQQRGAQQVPIARFSQGGGMSSSLAGVFGRPAAQAQAQAQLVPATFPSRGEAVANSESPFSREPSLGTDGSGSSGSPGAPASLSSYDTGNVAVKEEDGLRPTFKRLPSQTLGPPNSKRAFRGPAEEDDERGWAYHDEKEEEDRKPPMQAQNGPAFGVISGSIAERRRRMSAPAPKPQVGYAPVGQV